jgi:carbamoyl-phosphate synthase large subunit
VTSNTIPFPSSIAVTGMNARPDNPGPGLGVAHCLKDATAFDGRIVGLGYEALDPGIHLSHYCDAGYLLPYPSSGDDVLLERLKMIRDREQIDALIPCLDAELPSVTRLAGELRSMGIQTFVPSPEQLNLRNKDRLEELASHAGITAPETKPIADPEFFFNCSREGWHYPLVVKGIFYDAEVVRSAEQGVAAFNRISSHWGLPVLVQEFLEGEEVNLTAVGDGQGRLLGAVMMRKLALTDKGKAWAGVTIADDRLYEASIRLASNIHWKGPLEVEVMKEPDGTYRLIEINPRFPAWVYLTAGAGRNVLDTLIELLRGNTPPDRGPAPAGFVYIRYAEDTIIPLREYESVIVNGWRLRERTREETTP